MLFSYLTGIDGWVWVTLIILLLIVDRWFIRNGTVELLEIGSVNYTKDHARISLTYDSNQRFIKSELTYTIRDMNDPTTVINGKDRGLEFSKIGLNSEYLLINKKLLQDGNWIVDVKVTTTGSRINYFHKIFPISTHIQKQVEIKL